MDRSDLANRMKEYEKASQRYLTRRMPVMLRLDGCHFHSFTKKFKRPFDEVLIKSMQETARYLCENIQGAVLAYCQSDEISIILVDYKKINSSAWFDNRQNKIESVAASMATMAFNKFFEKNVNNEERVWEDVVYHYYNGFYFNDDIADKEKTLIINKNEKEFIKGCKYLDHHKKALEKGAMFDCRAFNIPKEEVTNCIYWRQLDCSRNSIQMIGQANFSHKELQNKTCNMIQDMLMTQKGINWNDLPTYQKRGTCVVRNKIDVENNGITGTAMLRDASKSENEWIIDKEIPIFRGEGREYIERLINF